MNAPHTPHDRPQTPREGFRRSTDTGKVSGPLAPTDATAPDAGGRFSTLFADPHHYRGDCRRLRTAIRRGWLDAAPQDVRDALVDRFNAATAEREAAGFASDSERARVLMAEIRVALELGRSNLADAAVGLRWLMTGDPKYPNEPEPNILATWKASGRVPLEHYPKRRRSPLPFTISAHGGGQMTNESVKSLILAFNSGHFPSFVALRSLSDTVTLGYVWPERPNGREPGESSRKVYFVLAGSKCVGVVVEMGFHHSQDPAEEENLHWYVLEEHRKRGYLHAALRDFILPNIFSDGRETQKVSTDNHANANYVVRQGFTPTGEMSFIMTKDQVVALRGDEGVNSLPTREEMAELKARLREARGLIASVSERLRCHYGTDSLGLDELAECIEQSYTSRLSDVPNEPT